MNTSDLLVQYHTLRTMSDDQAGWFDTEIGSDLWVDGLNVFLTVEPEDFEQALERFTTTYDVSDDRMTTWLQALHRFCVEMATEGEFELYQALAVGMSYLSARPEINDHMFNMPARILNHSTALLLSPTYMAVWIHSYNEGYELYVDPDENAQDAFRPEHGRIYQRRAAFVGGDQGTVIRYPFQNYIHEMMHILNFHDLYTRVLGTPEEDITYFTHIEGSVSVMEEVIMRELMAIRDDLNLIDDGFSAVTTFPEYGTFRYEVMQGQHEGVTDKSLFMYRKRVMLLGEGEFFPPDNAIKEQILATHHLSDYEFDMIHPSFKAYLDNQHRHVRWAKKAIDRNRIPGFREVIELLPRNAYCAQKLTECLAPDAWHNWSDMLSCTTLPEPDPQVRKQSKEGLAWKELLYRLAEMRGYLSKNYGSDGEQVVQGELFDFAKYAVDRYTHPDSSTHDEALHQTKMDILTSVSHVTNPECREKLSKMIVVPGSYLLEPK
ncbi:hypothetical protein CIG75_01590 [Tumebacillus algifaecis]|uniref:Uncharacterized protein n=1 Tax=Tumebacillus algifaecis TaxID=1214604 RepID=A0A223CWX9_9BACL|nr:hypothetical protein [Tumebacillus algifaecis]ASS73792.1 hypothetical protein CIG75_01590 [Tumebacillus algifaecis]